MNGNCLFLACLIKNDCLITLIGGGSLLYGLPKFIEEYAGVKVNTTSSPKTCVALGTAAAIRNFDLLKNGDYKFSSIEEYI